MELRLPAPCLVVLVGPSGSGKSTWAAQTFHTDEIVSSDRLRAMVGAGEDDQTASPAAFALLEQIVTARLGRRLTTVIDTLGYDQEGRRRWVGLAHGAGLPAFAIVFEAPATEVERRNQERKRPIPKTALTRQLSRFKKVQKDLGDDGFDQIHARQQTALVTTEIHPGEESRRIRRDREHSFGLMINRFDWGLGREELAMRLASIAQRAESAGFRDLWVMDHFRQIPQVGRAWEDIPEAYTVLGYLAGVTTSIRLGTLVSSVTHRHPAVLGRMVATLDVVSGGRAGLGIGIGWDEKEHRSYGIPFPAASQRYAMLEDTVEMLPLLWGKGSPSFAGRVFTAEELACYPRPIQDQIPILIGGSGEQRTLRLVARHAQACNLFGRPDVIARKVEILRRHCVEEGRDPARVEVTHLVNAMTATDRSVLRDRIERLRPRNTTSDEYAARHRAGTPEDQVAHFAAYAEAGADHSIVVLPDVHLEGSIEAFAEVIEAMTR
jgi:F420-dependent oxidoreductase-like protein